MPRSSRSWTRCSRGSDVLERSPSPECRPRPPFSGSVTPVGAKFLGACGYASYRPAMAYTDVPSAVGTLRPAAAPRLALAAPQPDRRRALKYLHPIYALVIASLMVPAVALALMAGRALAAEPQMPENFQNTWCLNGDLSNEPTLTAIPCSETQVEVEITATKVNFPAASCVVSKVTKFDVCPWGMIFRNRERARALSKVVSDKPVESRLSHRAPVHGQSIGDDKHQLGNGKGLHPRCAARLSVSVG